MSKERRRLHPFFSDILVTIVTQGFVMSANLLSVALVGRWMSVALLGEFLLVKRVSAWLTSGSQLGLGIAVPREIAHDRAAVEDAPRRYFIAGMLSVLLALAAVSLLLFAVPQWSSKALFGQKSAGLLIALLLVTAGNGTSAMVFSYYRGMEKMMQANTVQTLTSAVIPIVAITAVLAKKSIVLVLGLTGGATIAVSVLWGMWILRRYPIRALASLLVDGRKLLSYGIRRVPGDLASGGLFALSPMIAAHYLPPSEVGFLLLGTTTLTAASMSFAPIGVVLLGKVSRMIGEGNHERVQEYVGHLRSAVLQVSLVMMVQGLVFAKPLLRWWIGRSGDSALPIVLIAMVSVPAYMYFVALRTAIDAATPVAHNARNVFASVVFIGTLSWIAAHKLGGAQLGEVLAAITTVGVYLLALLTNRTLSVVKMGKMEFSQSFALLFVLTSAISLAVQYAFHFDCTKLVMAGTVILEFGLTFVVSRRHRPEWVDFVYRVGLTAKASRAV